MTRPGALVAVTLLLVSGCRAPAPPPPADAGQDEPRESPSPVRAADPDARLELLSSRSRSPADDYETLELSGENKPNGLEYRLRRSLPFEIPAYLPHTLIGLELFIAEPVPEGWMAFYREPLEQWEGTRNADFHAVLFGEGGERFWELDLNRFLSRADHLEIQDIRYVEGKLYFNEACQSYSREAGGRCSALVRLDPWTQSVDWRTPPLTSNNIFIFHGPYLIAGYGFTREPDTLFLIDGETGEILDRQELDSAHSYLEIQEERLIVVTYTSVYTFRLPDSGPLAVILAPERGSPGRR